MTSIQLPLDLVVSTDRRFLNRDQATTELLNIVGVDPKYQEYVRVLDTKGSLKLLHYISTWVSTDDHSINEEIMRDIGHVRGIVVDTEANRIVCRSLPYTPELVATNASRRDALLPADLANSAIYTACEGTVLRLFHSGDEWHLSTHRKIDANNSYWSGPTFGVMFEELRKFQLADLDTRYCYVFLMSHTENRLVYRINESQLMLIAMYDTETQRYLEYNKDYGVGHPATLNPDGVVYPTTLQLTDKTAKGLADFIAELSLESGSYNKVGAIVFPSLTDPHPVKIVSDRYYSVRNARGNDPSLRTRYIQLRGTADCGLMINWFTEPGYQEVFDDVEAEVDKLVTRLHGMYINRYVNKDFSQLPKEEFVTLQRCHSWHVEDRSANIVTADKVREVVNTTPNHYLFLMLNRQRREERATEQKE